MIPRKIDSKEHGIPVTGISRNARKVLERLHEEGYRACLVGGAVRDLLLGREPKDFDIATDALPEDVRRLFRNCRLIGRRFRLAHVHFGREIIEVATFRAPHDEADTAGQAAIGKNGRIVRDNVYGTLEQDVWRRDFTVNALYYDVADASVIDYVVGVEDLKQGLLRLIGNPEIRYREDPVRMLRAVRFAAKLGFRIDPVSEAVILDLHALVSEAAPARLFEEFLKLMHGGYALETFELLRHYHLFEHLFPAAERHLNEVDGEFLGAFIAKSLANTDLRIQEGKPVNPAFLIAVMLWGTVHERMESLVTEGLPPAVAIQKAGQEALSAQVRHISVPRRFSMVAREIWELQSRLLKTRGRQPRRLVEHPRFRAGYDFLCLRARAGDESLAPPCEWWTRFQEANPVERRAMAPVRGRPRQRRRNPRSHQADQAG